MNKEVLTATRDLQAALTNLEKARDSRELARREIDERRALIDGYNTMIIELETKADAIAIALRALLPKENP